MKGVTSLGSGVCVSCVVLEEALAGVVPAGAVERGVTDSVGGDSVAQASAGVEESLM